MGKDVEYISGPQLAGGDKVYLVAPREPEEIDLAGLFADLIAQWRILAVIFLIGLVGSTLVAFTGGSYLVEVLLRRPTMHELGSATRQNLVDMNPETALNWFVDVVSSPEIHSATLASSGIGELLREETGLNDKQVARDVFERFSLSVVTHEHYQLQKNEKTPLVEIRASLVTGEPQRAVEYLQALIGNGLAETKRVFTDDVIAVRSTRTNALQERIAALTAAETKQREATIERLVEANDQAIAELQQQVDTLLEKARIERENRIVRLSEALQTAEGLDIREPVTWDDLRPLARSSQVINELGDVARSDPLYFRGTRLLQAELQQLRARTSDRPFISGLVDIENEIEQKRNDVRIAALKLRANDEIYVEEYGELQRQLSNLLRQPTDFSDATFAVVTQPAAMPLAPLRSPGVIIAVGMILSMVIGLVASLLWLAVQRTRGKGETLQAPPASQPRGSIPGSDTGRARIDESIPG